MNRYIGYAAMAASMVFVAYLSSARAHAAGWTGCHFGAHAGVAVANDKATLAFGGTSVQVDGFGAQGGQVGVGFGCDVTLDKFVFGAFGDATWADTETKISLTAPGGSAAITQSFKDSYALGGRAGILLTPAILAYGTGGRSWANTSDIVLTAPGGGGMIGLSRFEGWFVGGGLETHITPSLSIKTEYRWNRYDGQTVSLGGPSLTLEPDVHSVWVGLNWRFDANAKELIPSIKP